MTTLHSNDFDRLKEEFIQLFGDDSQQVRIFFAPGRVNLIGEHTDYNGGYVFPAALTYGTWALARPRQDGIYRFASTNFPGIIGCSVIEGEISKGNNWGDYPKGVLQQLQRYEGLTGADILYHGNIPNGAGLSSSASLEMVTALAITTLADLNIPMIELVQLSQCAENQFVGVNCGIMDQFAVGMGKRDHAMFLKSDTLAYEHVPLKIDGYKLVITNTNKRRGLADSKYNERRQECETGLAIIQEKYPKVTSLGDLRFEEWVSIRNIIEDTVIYNRLEHVISEDERVIKAKESLQNSDLLTFGQLMKASHESLRDLYEVTGFELDTLFEEASKIDGCIGTRMTGAGFGGCNVSLVAEGSVEQFKEVVGRNYKEKTGLTPTFYVCEIGDGAKEILEEV